VCSGSSTTLREPIVVWNFLNRTIRSCE
jgi:hypothetical protein